MSGPPVLWPLVQVAHLARRRLTSTISADGVSGPQFGVLAALLDGDDLSSSDLARALLVRPQSMAGLVESLVDLGLVARSGSGGRGRRTTLGLTSTGRATAERVRARVHALADPSVTGLTDAEAAQLAMLLEKVRSALETDEPA